MVQYIYAPMEAICGAHIRIIMFVYHVYCVHAWECAVYRNEHIVNKRVPLSHAY